MQDETFDPNRWQNDLYRDTARTHRYDGTTGEEFAEWQTAFRRDLHSVLGHDVIRENSPDDPDPQRLTAEERDGHVCQEWSLRTETGVRVPFYLLLPSDVEPPYPVAFAIHGHNETGKELMVGKYTTEQQREASTKQRRDMALQAVQRGYAAIAADMRAFGALADSEPKEGDRACTRMQKNAQLYGRTLAGERVWDVLRLLDFVEEQSELDESRIAITGHSGGGAVTLFAAALDERISTVAPNAYFCTFVDSIVSIDHCECNYVPGVLRLGEMWDIAGLIAPRPMVVATGERDHIFPIEGTRRAFENLSEIYAAVGAKDRCELHVGDDGHRFYPDGVWPFVEAHL